MHLRVGCPCDLGLLRWVWREDDLRRERDGVWLDGLRHDVLRRDDPHVQREGLSPSIRREVGLILHRDLMTTDRIRNDWAVKQFHI